MNENETRIDNEQLCNVRRLAYTLFQYSSVPEVNAQLARILHYMPEQLHKDIIDLENYTAEKVAADREMLDELNAD